MSASVYLNSYVVRIKRKFSRESEPLNSFSHGNDLYEVLKDLFTSFNRKYKNDEVKKLTYLFQDCICDDTTRSICGVVKIGEYGFERETLDVKSNQTDVIDSNRSVMVPNFFYFSLPKNTQKGIALFANYKRSSALSIINEIITDQIVKKFNDYIPQINPLYPQDQVEKFLNRGSLGKLTFIKHEIPKNIEDMISDGTEKIRGQTELVVKITKSTWREKIYEKIHEYFNAEEDIKTLYEFEGFGYDEIKATIRIGGRNRDINLTDLGKTRANFDITSSIVFLDDGNPSFDSLKTSAMALLSDLRSQLGD